MATSVYEEDYINLVDGSEVRLTPLKIKYLRRFMKTFSLMKYAKNDNQAITVLSNCAFIALSSQYSGVKTQDEFDDNLDMPAVYKILDVCAGIKIQGDSEETIKEQAEESKSNTWDDLDLAKLESEIFLVGIWKDYEELESSLSMPELLATISSKRELDYDEKKFLAAIQGVDIDSKSGKGSQNEWEQMKARVFSQGKTEDSNDITSFQGAKARKMGFGVGMGLDFEDLT